MRSILSTLAFAVITLTACAQSTPVLSTASRAHAPKVSVKYM